MTKEGASSLLRQWAGYLRHNHTDYLGYPRENILGRVMREGAGASQATAPSEYSPPVYFETIDRIVSHMEPLLRQAIYYRFVDRLKDAEAAGKFKCSKSEYRNRVDRGIIFTAGAMTYVE